jgi:ABC-2 type transport system permease protein
MAGPLSGAVRYVQVAKITWKAMLAYQADTWLGALFAGARILLAYLLWSAIFAGQSEVAGYTLPLMVLYTLIASLLGRLQHYDGLAWQLASEVRDGQFSKYLVHPVTVLGYFISAGLGRWLYNLLVYSVTLVAWGLVFSRWIPLPFASLAWGQSGWFILILCLGALFMLLLNHFFALFSLKFMDITGLMMIKGGIIDFLSGAIIPLDLLPAVLVGALKFSPFYYVIYYPTTLMLGRQTEPPALAALILAGWCLTMALACEAWFRRARHLYEGVGI